MDLKDAVTKAISKWQQVNMLQLQTQMDKVWKEIEENQQSTLQNRKQLAELTKQYRQSSAGNSADVVKLIKHYQTEIDSLSKKLKFVEFEYMGVCNLLMECVDPAPLLEKCRIQLDAPGDNNANAEILAAVEKEWKAKVEEERLRSKELESQLELLRSQAQVRKLSESNDISASRETYITQLEQELEKLRLKLSREETLMKQGRRSEIMLSPQNANDMVEYQNTIKNLNQILSKKDDEVAALKDSLKKTEGKLEEIKKEKNAMQSEIMILRQKLKDFDEIKKELDAFREVEFSNFQEGLSVQALAIQKARKLQTDLTQIRTEFNDYKEKGYEKKVEDLEKEVENYKQMIKKLETDVVSINRPSSVAQDNSLVSVLTSQRDRFHQRNMELEATVRQLQNDIYVLKAENERSKQFEVSIEPPRRLGFQNSTDRRQRADGAVLKMFKIFMSNSIIRTSTLIYVVALHLLVFFTLFRFGVWEECRHDHDVDFWREKIKNDPSYVEQILKPQ
ncbi:hypothetical protein MP638_005250 [Amoeboaphelidium occidentale]|nr:hypothetical protein MP638_005250 [Amoeboaphelidium occidentale]